MRILPSSPPRLEDSDRLAEACIENLIVGSLWPNTDFTPEALGMKGWDGNAAIEWISEQLRSGKE